MIKDIESFSKDNDLIKSIVSKAEDLLNQIKDSKSINSVVSDGVDLVKTEF